MKLILKIAAGIIVAVILLTVGCGLLVSSSIDTSKPKPLSITAVSNYPNNQPATPTVADSQQSFNYGSDPGDKGIAVRALAVKDDGLGDIGGTVRLQNVTDRSGSFAFTITFFQGGSVIGSVSGAANDVASGRTITSQLVSTDPIMTGRFHYEFQVDYLF